MRTKRINTDIYDSLELKNSSDGSAMDLTDAYDMHLYLRRDGSSVMLEQVFTITDNKIYYQYNSKENNALGIYNLHFYYKKNNANSENGYDQYHFDVSWIFTIVKSSEQENWAGGITSVVSQYGADGLSAYQLAVRDGFTGTITQWLVSLKGEKGDEGEKGNAFTYSDFTSEQIATLQKPATDAASNLTSFESNITNAENERVIAENARNNAETTRESNSATAVTNANNAASNANTAASNFANAVVQEEGTNTDKVISQKVVTDELANKVDKIAGMGLSTNDYTNTDKSQVAQNKDTNSIQDTVVAEALAKLNQEFEALKKIIASGNLGDVHVTSLTSDNVPKYCGQSMILNGSGSPITNAVLPAFEGQIYVDTTNRNVYMCSDSSSATYWKQLN